VEIRKKVWPEYYAKIVNGTKKWDLRLADFNCRPGDTLILEEWDPKTRKYTGRTTNRKVAYVVKTRDLKFWPEEEMARYGLQVIQFAD